MRFPSWLCAWVFDHALLFFWADYMSDVSGLRCRCGKRVEMFQRGQEIIGGVIRVRVSPYCIAPDPPIVTDPSITDPSAKP